MTSEAQIAANQQNAKLSTGPKTEEGKKLTFLNARKHGFAAAIDMEDHNTNAALAVAGQLLENSKQINLLGIYEQRKMRNFNETRKELKEMQAERKEAEKKELEKTFHFRNMEKANRKPDQPEWNPAEDGFVCSLAEIDAFIPSHKRHSAAIKFFQTNRTA